MFHWAEIEKIACRRGEGEQREGIGTCWEEGGRTEAGYLQAGGREG